MKKITEEDIHEQDYGSPPSTPRWVKVFGVIGLVFALLFVLLHLTGQSPFMHMKHGG